MSNQSPRPRLFEPSVTRKLSDGYGIVLRKSGADLEESNAHSTSSFRYDPPGTGLKSTQQIGLDFSKFENHTFFNSAVVNVNVAFNKIVQEYPFDGTRGEVEEFFDKLTGFEKYVYDSLTKNKGFLLFSGSTGVTPGTYIRVIDSAGATIPTISKVKNGTPVIDPGIKSFSAEMFLLPATGTNDNQIVCQKLTGSNFGFSLVLSQSASPHSCSIIFLASSGTQHISASATIMKGKFSHVVATMNRKPGINRAQLFIDEALVGSSANYSEIGDFGFSGAPLVIGSGSLQNTFTPIQTLSGALDEFRFFHDIRSVENQKKFGRRTIYATPELKVYFKFNEPTGTFGSDNIAIDSSGNSLHSVISGFGYSLRSTGSFTVPITYENLDECPVIFPKYANFVTLNTSLLTSASRYDSENPNLITRLIPDHYFNIDAHVQGFDSDDGDFADAYVGGGMPRTGQLASAPVLSMFLYVYAKYFDELKVMLDAFSNVINVDYDPETSAPDQFLALAAKFRGFELPSLFGNSSIEQHIFGQNLLADNSSGTSLSTVQNQIWRRILANLGEIIRSKGTVHSIKALIRATGINPDSSMRIREYGGPTRLQLTHARQARTEVASMLDFSGTLASSTAPLSAQGISQFIPYLMSPFMTGTRREVGFPDVRGTMTNQSPANVHGISNKQDDGLFTSGSWTYEGIYKFPTLLTGTHFPTQSLVRLQSTGSLVGHNLLANVVVFASESGGEDTATLRLYARPSSVAAGAPTLQMDLTGVNVFDGDKWSISFGRNRGDSINSRMSEYFLRAGRQNFGTVREMYATATFFREDDNPLNIVWQNYTTSSNASGTFIVIGSQSLSSAGAQFLNSLSAVADGDARATQFTGKIGQVRFWSKGLRLDEWVEHVRNFKSVGVRDPTKNFNFAYLPTGSFERLRMDVSLDQYLTSSDTGGNILAWDFSQNGLHFTGSGFESSTPVIDPETFYYSFLSPKFDEASTTEKIRARGYINPVIDTTFSGSIAPVYEIDKSEEPHDDPRFSIDISSVAALNEDIVNIFATFEALDNALGAPELQFSPDYPALEHLRLIYFNRLTNKINLKSFFEFFRWFDTSMGIFIERLLPRKTKFLGINYVIEPHMLERSKFEHYTSEAYLGESNRPISRPTILLQQIVGTMTRY